MRFARIIAFMILISAAAPAAAEDYAPGTVGYLYEDCVAATQAETLDDFVGSYCARFVSGYFWGYARSNYITRAVKPNDPCKADLERLFTHIEGRACQSVAQWPDYAKKEPLLALMHLFFGWVDYLKENGQDHVLRKPAAAAFNDMIRPGPYCAVVDAFDGMMTRYPLSPAVHKARNNPLALKKAYDALIAAPAAAQCADDTGAPDSFRASSCGAEIMGYVAGINSAQWIQENRQPATDPACQPGVTRLYNNLDAAGYSCVGPEADPMLLALAYLKNPPQDKKPVPVGKALARVSLCPAKSAGE
jgi:hypothetical protein